MLRPPRAAAAAGVAAAAIRTAAAVVVAAAWAAPPAAAAAAATRSLGPDIVFGNRTTAEEREDGEVTIGYVGPAEAPQIFECTGAAANYTVPAGASALSIVAAGAAGGNGPAHARGPG